MKKPLPTPATSRSRVILKRRLRAAKRVFRSPRVATGVRYAAFLAVCILLLGVFDVFRHSKIVPHPSLATELAQSWKLYSVRTARLDPNSYPSPKELHRFISGAVRYIVRASKTEAARPKKVGRFAYRYTLESDGSISHSSSYNTLRHSGTAYSLADACPPTIPSSQLPQYCDGSRQALIGAANWLTHTIAPMNNAGVLGLWSRPSDEFPKRIKTLSDKGDVRAGGIGLGLISMIAGLQSGSFLVNMALLRDVARGATDVFQQRDGSMFAYFSGKKMKLDRERENPYYAGEAALGLLRLYSINGNSTLRTAASRALQAIARKGDEDEAEGYTQSCDHWALISTATLFRDPTYRKKSVRLQSERKLLLRHARRVVRACYKRNKGRLATNKVRANGCGSSTEAQLGMLPILTAAGSIDDEETEAIFCMARQSLGAAMSMQYHDNGTREKHAETLDGGVANAGELVSVRNGRKERRNFDGVFQIDTTQHTLSAALAYMRIASIPRFASIECTYENPLVEPYGKANVVNDE